MTTTAAVESILDLDDPLCRDPSIAGGKAAGLSRARSAGLPALKGIVVATGAAAPTLRVGAAALAIRGSGSARLAALAHPMDAELVDRLRIAVRELGGDVIVRSSADVEAGAEWSGAFSTFSDIGVDDVATAVRGCWASAFALDVIERGERTGVSAEQLSVAVLVQPRIEPRTSGLARAFHDSVEIEAVAGSAAALMSGWSAGERIVVGPDAAVTSSSLLSASEAREVARLATLVHERLGHRVIEWAWTDSGLVLLQSLAAPEPSTSPGPVDVLSELDHPEAERIAQLAVAFPGGVCDDLVFPWLLGARGPLGEWSPASALRTAPARALDVVEAQREATHAAAPVWPHAADPVAECRLLLQALRGPSPAEALSRAAALGPPDPHHAHAVVRLLAAAGRHAVETGRLFDANDVFGVELAEIAADRPAAVRQSWAGARRWEPFLAGVAQARGQRAAGRAAAPGVGAGAVRIVSDAHERHAGRRPRQVIVAPLPVPALSSLLWDAAGLVTIGGSTGAHLIEVARSLGVPAVVQCGDLPLNRLTADTIVAVDGDRGQVSWL
jgi:phosphoenolpyruvate synthase/pyruvate phosphate dikinase